MTTLCFRVLVLTYLLAHLSLAGLQSHAFELIRTLNDPSPTRGDMFGASLDVDAGRVLVGAPGHDASAPDVGEAHLFSSTTGELLQTFHAPDNQSSSSFGITVAIDGNRVVIGDPRDSSRDQVHVFDAQSGELLRTIENSDISLSDFVNPFANTSGAIDLEGNQVLVRLRQGVGLYDIETGEHLRTFTDPHALNGSGTGGFAIDGGRVLLSAFPFQSSTPATQAYLFEAASGALIQSFSDPVVSAESDAFGVAVALDGDRVLIGDYEDPIFSMGQAYLFDALNGQLLQTLTPPGQSSVTRFGMSVALDDDLTLLGNFADGGGSALLFDSVTGELLKRYVDPTTDRFGVDLFSRLAATVAIEGNLVVIGEYGDSTTNGFQTGQVHLFSAVDPNTPPDPVIPEPSSAILFLGCFAWLQNRRSGLRAGGTTGLPSSEGRLRTNTAGRASSAAHPIVGVCSTSGA